MLYLLTKGKDPIDHFKNNAWVASIYTFVMHMNSNQWRIQLVTSAHPQSQKKYITQEYILSNSVFCTTFTPFSLCCLSVLAFGSSLLPLLLSSLHFLLFHLLLYRQDKHLTSSKLINCQATTHQLSFFSNQVDHPSPFFSLFTFSILLF